MPFAACLEELLLPYALGLSETERAGLQIWHEGTGMLAELPTKSTMGGGLRAGELVSGASSEVCEAPGAGADEALELCLQLAVYDAREGAPATFMPSPLPPSITARSPTSSSRRSRSGCRCRCRSTTSPSPTGARSRRSSRS